MRGAAAAPESKTTIDVNANRLGNSCFERLYAVIAFLNCVCSILIPRFVSPPVILDKNRWR
jgi:hypothetical protein